jgi:hypothetical protein
MSDLDPDFRALPPLGAPQLEAALLGAVDLVLLMDTERMVTAVHLAPGLDLPFRPDWTGRDFGALVCAASRTKLTALFAQGQGTAANPARWRHLNFDFGRDSVPFLVKYFGFDGTGGGRHLIVGRDLRPTVQLQKRVQQVLVEMEQVSEDRGHGSVRDLRLGDAAARIGDRPLAQIVAETARTLERLCIDEALRRARGDDAAAAALLGLDPGEFALRRRML